MRELIHLVIHANGKAIALARVDGSPHGVPIEFEDKRIVPALLASCEEQMRKAALGGSHKFKETPL